MEHPSELRLDVHFREDEAIPLDALTTIVSNLMPLLQEYEVAYLGERTLEWNISTLQLSSIDVGVLPRQTKTTDADEAAIAEMTQQLIRDARALEAGGSPDDILPGTASRNWIKWMKLFQTGIVTTFSIRSANESVEMTREGAGALTPSTDRRLIFGTLRGTLNGVSFAGASYFTLRRIEGGRSLKCFFSDEMQEAVIAALRHQVDVVGQIRTNDAGEYQTMRITAPPRILRTGDQIPKIADLVGLLPDLTEGLDTVEWVRRQRIE